MPRRAAAHVRPAALTWADYDAKLISKGGGIFERAAKSIPLSPKSAPHRPRQGRGHAGRTDERLLKAVDLLWFGGIGTYVKSSAESHADVGDRANDAIRVNGRDRKAKVIGEGANLGFTQAGRIEFALAGGRSTPTPSTTRPASIPPTTK
jgi:glutamate dehydrogenase